MIEIFRHTRSHFLFIILLTAIAIAGCNDSSSNPDLAENELIGTWILSKIIVSYPSGITEFTPLEKRLEITIIILRDKTFRRHQNSKDVITNDDGTWSVTKGELTLLSTLGIFTFPCRVNVNTLQAASTITDPETGNVLPITLEFAKQ